MSEDFTNKISRIQIENFTVFEKADIHFSSGINVIIGENGTGKTHLLKLLYNSSGSMISSKMIFFFKVTHIKELLRNNNIDSNIKTFFSNRSPIIINILSLSEEAYESTTKGSVEAMQTTYLPPQEMLSWQEGFLSLYERKEVAFDLTYRNLALALDGLLLRNSHLEKAQKLVTELEKAIKGKVIKKDRKFYIEFEAGGTHESSVVATGINKIAQVIYLILNGSITKDSILFWDEPEASLNPRFIKIVSKFLQVLAKAGVQIFVATHDYLLVHQLSLEAEYRDENTVPMRFFSLYKDAEKDGTQVESGDTMAEIENNSILDEFAEHYNAEERKFSKSLNQK